MSLMLKTLIAPYRHDSIALTRLPVRLWGQAITANVVSRSIGLVLRGGVIVTGLLTELFTALGSVVFLIAWYLLPLLLVGSVFYGLFLLVTPGGRL